MASVASAAHDSGWSGLATSAELLQRRSEVVRAQEVATMLGGCWITFLVVWRCLGSRSEGAAVAEAHCRRQRLLQRKWRMEQVLEAAAKLGGC